MNGNFDNSRMAKRESLDLSKRQPNYIENNKIDKNDYYRRLSSVSLLILDDFGIERNTEYVNEMVYQIINTRY